MENKNKVKIIEKKFLGVTEYHLKLPKNFKLNWAYFHKFFRVVDGKNDEEQEAINNFYEAYRKLPDNFLFLAEDYLLELVKEDKDEDEK